MASATSVTSVSHVPFRRFLPHERQTVPTASRQDYHNDNFDEENGTGDFMPGLPQPLLSDADMSVLIEAGHPEDDKGYLTESVDTLYLPFTFALAAQQ